MALRFSFAVGLFGVALSCAIACSSSDDDTSANDYAGSCKLLASRCHPVQTALGKECHDLGHDGNDSACGPRKAECLAECPEGIDDHDSGTHGDASSTTDASTDAATDAADAGPTACALYCTCMVATCKDEASYPYDDEADCLATCAGFAADGRTCVASACEKAKTGDKAHECEHAASASACH